MAALSGSARPSASTIDAIVDAVPIGLQCPALRVITDSVAEERLLGERAGAHLLAHPPHVGRRAEPPAEVAAGEHRATGQHDRRQVDRRRAHHHRRRGLVATGEQHDAVDRVGPDRLLDVHRHQVAQQHRRRLDLRLAERRDRELERHAARFPDAALDVLGQLPEVLVARGELGRRVADADHRLAGERVVGQAALHPAAVDVVVPGAAVVPAGGPQPDRRVLERHQRSLSARGGGGRARPTSSHPAIVDAERRRTPHRREHGGQSVGRVTQVSRCRECGVTERPMGYGAVVDAGAASAVSAATNPVANP